MPPACVCVLFLLTNKVMPLSPTHKHTHEHTTRSVSVCVALLSQAISSNFQQKKSQKLSCSVSNKIFWRCSYELYAHFWCHLSNARDNVSTNKSEAQQARSARALVTTRNYELQSFIFQKWRYQRCETKCRIHDSCFCVFRCCCCCCCDGVWRCVTRLEERVTCYSANWMTQYPKCRHWFSTLRFALSQWCCCCCVCIVFHYNMTVWSWTALFVFVTVSNGVNWYDVLVSNE